MFNARAKLIVMVCLLAAIAAAVWVRRSNREGVTERINPENALQLLLAYEDQEASKYWGPELIAQKYGAYVDRFWDRLNRATNKWNELSRLEFSLNVAPRLTRPVELRHGISVLPPSAESWRSTLKKAQGDGWDLVQSEFRHIRFQPGKGSQPESVFYISGHFLNHKKGERAIIEGNVTVRWGGAPDSPSIASVDASELEVRTRPGAPAFRSLLVEEIQPTRGSYFIDPLVVWDLDQDGALEVILVAGNVVLKRQPDGSWKKDALCEFHPGLAFTGMLGDFDGDAHVDLITVTFDGLTLRRGAAGGKFPGAGELVWRAEPRIRYAQTLAAGDIDADGDLDLFLGQYKPPYDKGQMPRPYFDARDGHPSFLLLNEGTGKFVDVTDRIAFGSKLQRRAYSSSFIDLDRDDDLDLLVVSDFAGIDVYANNGRGSFSDVTANWFDETAALGMSHSFADFNSDGRLDILMIGMNSPVTDRLGFLGLNRPYDLPDNGKRGALTHGNRLYIGQEDGTFREGPLSARIARSGWSWGVTAGDVDNDGFPDAHIANGHETKGSVQDYETEFWLHDIYVGNSQENALANGYFQHKFIRTRGRGHSYGGYEKNRLFLNQQGTNFVEVAHLFGVAIESDSRNCAFADLTGDGKLDLIVTTFEAHPTTRQTVQLFENQLADISVVSRVALRPQRLGKPLTISSPQGQRASVIVGGDGYRTQSPLSVRLGASERIKP